MTDTFADGLARLFRAVTGHPPASPATGPDFCPPPLLAFYGAAQAYPAVLTSHHRFVPLVDLVVEGPRLVFCFEHQDTMFWGLRSEDLDHIDPPVLQGRPNTQDWYAHCPELSTFLLNFAAWQLVNALPSVARLPLEVGTIRSAREIVPPVSARLGYDMVAFASPDTGIVASALLGAGQIYFGALTDDALHGLESTLGEELDWL